jgi:hypothetical protein
VSPRPSRPGAPELIRLRDRRFVPYDHARHARAAYAIASNTLSFPEGDLFPPPGPGGASSAGGAANYVPARPRHVGGGPGTGIPKITRPQPYHVSVSAQLAAWSRAVLFLAGGRCDSCDLPAADLLSLDSPLAARHVFEVQCFRHLRYLVANGRAVCRDCWARARPRMPPAGAGPSGDEDRDPDDPEPAPRPIELTQVWASSGAGKRYLSPGQFDMLMATERAARACTATPLVRGGPGEAPPIALGALEVNAVVEEILADPAEAERYRARPSSALALVPPEMKAVQREYRWWSLASGPFASPGELVDADGLS